MASSPILALLHRDSPTLHVCQPETGLGILASRQERAYLLMYPPKTRDEFQERVARMVTAYAGVCSIVAQVSGRFQADTVNAVVTVEDKPYIAFGSTIAEKRGSAAKRFILRLRGADLREATRGITLRPPPMSRVKRGVRGGRLREYCAEVISVVRCVPPLPPPPVSAVSNLGSPHSLLPHIRRSLNPARQIDAASLALSARRLARKNPATGRPYFIDALDTICQNCEWWIEDVFGMLGAVVDWCHAFM
ncbi:hypothetical protein C8J57DRAFT_1342769 [Mycena rebaudengoi]|nr:hypothetical protein C8J57DRAFT_1342769 [Mycena rebaudengoi]